MRKTLLASIVCASVFAIPAFAQVSLGGAAQVSTHAGAGLPLGAPVHDGMDMAHQTGNRATNGVQSIDRRARHTSHHVVHQTATSARRDDHVATHASASANAGTSNAHADAALDSSDAGRDVRDATRPAIQATDHTAGTVGDAARGAGWDVRNATHAAIRSTDRTAGSVGEAAHDAATGNNAVNADADVKAKASVHGH